MAFFKKFWPHHKNQAVNVGINFRILRQAFVIVIAVFICTGGSRLCAQSFSIENELFKRYPKEGGGLVLHRYKQYRFSPNIGGKNFSILENKPVQRPFSLIASSNTFNAQCLPFFCKIEYRLEQKTNIPLRFRLGSLAYTDYLEGKSGSYLK